MKWLSGRGDTPWTRRDTWKISIWAAVILSILFINHVWPHLSFAFTAPRWQLVHASNMIVIRMDTRTGAMEAFQLDEDWVDSSSVQRLKFFRLTKAEIP